MYDVISINCQEYFHSKNLGDVPFPLDFLHCLFGTIKMCNN